MITEQGVAVKVNKAAVGILLTLVLTMGSNSAFASSFYSVNPIAISVSKSAVPKPKISNSLLTNTLTARIGKVKKASIVSYQWIRNGAPIPGEINPTYEWQATDCSQDIQVRVTVKEKGKKENSKASSSYNPSVCQYTTGDIPAWNILHNCGIPLPSPASPPACTEWTYSGPGGFYGFAYRSARAQPWFRIPLNGIDPSRVISWQAEARGLFHDYTRSLTMITKNEPSWACCDWKGTKFPGRTFPVSTMYSDEVLGISPDGAAYVGFNFYDPYGVSESLVVDSIRVTFKFK